MDKFNIRQKIQFYELDSVYGNIPSIKPYTEHNINYLVAWDTKSKTHNRSKLIFEPNSIPIPTKGIVCILPIELESKFDINNPKDVIHQMYELPPTQKINDVVLFHKLWINEIKDPVYLLYILFA